MIEYCQIELTQGQVARISPEDWDLISAINWYACRPGTTGYMAASKAPGTDRVVYMHRLLMNPPQGMMVDHISGDSLDNRRENLRLASAKENSRNRKARRTGTGIKGITTGYKGRWRALIGVDGREINLGSYSSQEEAHAAYCVAAAKYHGEFARTD